MQIVHNFLKVNARLVFENMHIYFPHNVHIQTLIFQCIKIFSSSASNEN
jgi:hypothetical protein